jgi:hypothetical protein
MSDDHIEQTLLLNKISEQVTEQTKVMAKLDKKVDLNIQKVQYELEKIHVMDAEQNKLLDAHIEGVKTLKKMHDDHLEESDTRFEKLEAPRKWLKMTKNIILVVGALAVAMLGIIKLLEIF